jgi:hypothetical protein
LRGQLSGSGEYSQRDGQIETSALLRQIGRRQVHRYAPHWEFEACVEKGGAHAILAFLYRGLRQPDDVQVRQAVGQMNLYADGGGGDPLLRAAQDNGEGQGFVILQE